MFDMVNTAFSYGRGLIVCSSALGIFEDKGKYSACDLKCRYCIFTLWGQKYACNFRTHCEQFPLNVCSIVLAEIS